MERAEDIQIDNEIGKKTEYLYKTIARLRGPQGCPWDKKQTLESMRQYLIEETYETISAINNYDNENITEELGDLILIIFMMSIIGAEEKKINITKILDGITEKIIRRHPHVFGDESADNPDEVVELWNSVKEKEKMKDKAEQNTEPSIPFTVDSSFPEIERAYRIQKEAGKMGFDWNHHVPVIEKLKEEIVEFENAASIDDKQNIEEELGDLFFTLVNLSRKMKVHPSIALHKTNEKFIKRFKYVVDEMRSEQKEMNEENMDLMEEKWQQSKLFS